MFKKHATFYLQQKRIIKMIEVDSNVISDIRKGFYVPAQPKLLLDLQDLMAKEEPELNTIADTISQDVAVSATILKTINSPIYGLSRSISDIKKSVRYIGLTGINSLVTNTLIQRSFDQDSCSIALTEFWDNARNIANACVLIGKSLKQAVSYDKLFSLGLFHDCGIPVMAMKYNDYENTFKTSLEENSETLTKIEESIYHVNHATIGYYVATSWRLPKDICELILAHHDHQYILSNANRIQKFYYAILKLAENIVHLNKHKRNSNDWACLEDSILELLGVKYTDYQQLIEQVSGFDFTH